VLTAHPAPGSYFTGFSGGGCRGGAGVVCAISPQQAASVTATFAATPAGAGPNGSLPGAPVLPAAPSTTPPFAGALPLGATLVADKRGKVPVRVSCPPSARGACSGKVTLTAVTRNGRAAKKAKTKVVVLGSAVFSIVPGGQGRTTITLSSAGRRLVTKRAITVTATVVAHDARGVAVGRSAHVKLKKA
jgi:hypothetical protein